MDKYLKVLERQIEGLESESVWNDNDAAEYERTRKEIERVQMLIENRDLFNSLFQ